MNYECAYMQRSFRKQKSILYLFNRTNNKVNFHCKKNHIQRDFPEDITPMCERMPSMCKAVINVKSGYFE